MSIRAGVVVAVTFQQVDDTPDAETSAQSDNEGLKNGDKEMNKLLSVIGRNINQIAKRVNAGGPTYQADMEEIQERLDQIWQLQRRILLSQR